MKNETVTLLPCPFCGEALTINNANLGAHPRFSECIYAQQVVVADDAAQVAKWNTRATLAEPVPPAGGEVEVLGYRYDSTSEASKCLPLLREDKISTCRAALWVGRELVDRAHVTRLQAEVERLKGLAKAYIVSDGDRSLREHALRQDNERLQSELTKARERVYELEHAIFHALDDSIEYEALIDEVAITKLDFEKLNALLPEDWEHRTEPHQSAPAAKDDLVECDACPTSGGCVNTCMKAKDQQPAPVAVVLPERRATVSFGEPDIRGEAWNACLDEVARLNPIKP
ncbi:Lar family restriction alleviation protein [Pseudomonas sp. NFACC05-1]|uniref:Lar family restriction alleviation protein n=1 Tax=Pseudomonas sp. NFACC05-1 TaxID=1566241 RepID=UPI0008718642|nr:Lar family restriction alleviation protein [Pseudomonas sp. NFACC05-1]SCW88977.1 hypothetical protein SAMN03159424_03994 [Pseudomonas sp. NFACC05-1]